MHRDVILFLALVAVCALGYKYWEGRIRDDEAQKVEQRMHEAWTKKMRKAEAKAKDELEALRNEHDKAYRDLSSRAVALAGELQKRPTRAQLEAARQAGAASASACPVCTGAGLAREDGEFLAGEAAAAAAQQLDLQRARGAFATCSKALEEVTRGERDELPEESPGVRR